MAAHPAVDEAHGYIYFLSNKDDVPETQLYRVSLADKSIIDRITKRPGTHDVIVAPDDSAFRRYLFHNHDAAAPGSLPLRWNAASRRSTKINWPNSDRTTFRALNF